MRFLLLLGMLTLSTNALADLQISDAWIKNLPPTVPMRAGYLTIKNSQSSPVTIVGISSDRFARIELHQTIHSDGMMHMEPVENISLAPGDSVQLAPGGMHLMMMKADQPTSPGETIKIKLKFNDGSEQTVEMLVKP